MTGIFSSFSGRSFVLYMAEGFIRITRVFLLENVMIIPNLNSFAMLCPFVYKQ